MIDLVGSLLAPTAPVTIEIKFSVSIHNPNPNKSFPSMNVVPLLQCRRNIASWWDWPSGQANRKAANEKKNWITILNHQSAANSCSVGMLYTCTYVYWKLGVVSQRPPPCALGKAEPLNYLTGRSCYIRECKLNVEKFPSSPPFIVVVTLHDLAAIANVVVWRMLSSQLAGISQWLQAPPLMCIAGLVVWLRCIHCIPEAPSL